MSKFTEKYKEFVKDRYKRGESTPRWKAPVYYDWECDENVVAPILFHLFFRVVRNAYWRVVLYGWDSQRKKDWIIQNKVKEEAENEQ